MIRNLPFRTHRIQPRIAVYPWCGEDFVDAARMIEQSNLADQIIFCDVRRVPESFYAFDQRNLQIPCTYFQGYIYEDLDQLPIFDVLFQPGSGRLDLGKILNKMAVEKAYIITKKGRNISFTSENPFSFFDESPLPNYPNMQITTLKWSEPLVQA